MSRIVSVGREDGADGKSRHFVTVQQDGGDKQRIEVEEAQAEKFRRALKEQQQSPRLLTETKP